MLYRINAQSATYEKALADAGVPYLVRGGERFFERPEVREARLLLRGRGAGADDDPAGAPRRGRRPCCGPRRLDARSRPAGTAPSGSAGSRSSALHRLADRVSGRGAGS